MSYSSAVMADGPVGYYKLGEGSGATVVDSSGNGKNGSYVGAVRLTDSGPIVGETCAFFDKWVEPQYATIPYDAIFNLGDIWTIETLFKRDALASADRLVTKGSDAYGLFFQSDNTLASERSGWAVLASSSNTIEEKTTWHHAVATKNGTISKIYIDGIDVTTPIENSACTNNASALLIATNYNLSGSKFWIAHTAIYPTALSEARIVAHYNSLSITLNSCLPDADIVTPGWTTTPLYSKVNDSSDGTVIQATAS